jgi:hypothetical protein
MSRDKQKADRKLKRQIKKQISARVRVAFPDCVAEFCGQQGSAAKVSRTLGFRVRDAGGRYRSNIVWVDPDYVGEIDEAWVRWAVRQSNG